MTDQPQTERRRSAATRFFGGHPVNVVLKLAFVSLLAGMTMSFFGVDAPSLLRSAIALVRETFRDGLGIFRDLGGFILTGAALVVPIWLLMRISRRS